MSREILVRVFFFAALLFLLVQLYEVLSSFLKPIALATLLAVVFQPVDAWALRVTGGRRTAAAAIVTAAIVLLVALPATALSGVLAREAAGLVRELSQLAESGALERLQQSLTESLPGRLFRTYAPAAGALNIDLGELAQTALSTVGNTVVGSLGGVARNVASVVLNLFIVLFTVFFLFRDGDRMVANLRALVPMQPADKDRVLRRLREMIEAVVRGMVVTAALQGVLTGVGLAIVGVPYAAFLALASGVLSLFPFGAVVVWLGSSIYLFAIGSLASALFLVAWGAVVVGTIDNFVRPILIGGQGEISTLLLFFGMLGGIEAYGFLGLFLGPALMATLAAFVEIYREEYLGTGIEDGSIEPSERSRRSARL
ncbi:MAG TPA: AI-2E family transporter [Candidatus Binatia bacterium]|nr:AI-2E family transporter [Candidatus Binatia bacterium]